MVYEVNSGAPPSFRLFTKVLQTRPDEVDNGVDLYKQNNPDLETLQEAGGYESWIANSYGLKGPILEEVRQADSLKPNQLPVELQKWWPQIFSQKTGVTQNQP